jgi:hypothetical protein
LNLIVTASGVVGAFLATGKLHIQNSLAFFPEHFAALSACTGSLFAGMTLEVTLNGNVI